MPAVGDTLQLVRASIIEGHARADDEIPHGARNENFARACQRAHAGRDVHGDPTDVFASKFHLAGVQARPDLDPELLDGDGQRARTLDRAPGAVERREESVAGVLDVTATKLLDIARNDLVV